MCCKDFIRGNACVRGEGGRWRSPERPLATMEVLPEGRRSKSIPDCWARPQDAFTGMLGLPRASPWCAQPPARSRLGEARLLHQGALGATEQRPWVNRPCCRWGGILSGREGSGVLHGIKEIVCRVGEERGKIGSAPELGKP